MDNLGLIITTLGALLLVGLVGDLASRRLPVPRVTLLIVFGVVIGPILGAMPEQAEDWYPFVSDLALLMVGFLLGGKLSRKTLREVGRHVVVISLFEVAGVCLCVLFGLLAAGVKVEIALLLAGIAPASAPAAVTNVVQELKARGRYTDTLLGIVAIDDAWGLILFSVLLASVQVVAGGADGVAVEALLRGGWELGGAILLGLVVGVPAALLTGRLQPGEPTQAEALGVVLLAGGAAIWLEVSFLLTAMVVGATIVNLARHHDRPFVEIENIEWPFMVLFFVLAGASLHVEQLMHVGLIGVAYILLRAVGLVLGAFAGGSVSGAEPRVRRWMGLAIMPQAGVALGMALVAGNSFPGLRDTLLPLVIGSTVVFELLGPALTRMAILRAGEGRRESGG